MTSTQLPAPVAAALAAARAVLEGSPQTCRFHGDCPPTGSGTGPGWCEACVHPRKVRRALAYFRALTGEPPPPRFYSLDVMAGPHRTSGGYKVVGVPGLWAPADVDKARRLIVRELEARGELGPFDVRVSVPGRPA